MRWLCSILAILVLLLSAQPAWLGITASDTCVENCCDVQPETGKDHPDTEHKGCNKSCNPFQACSCCAFAAVIPSTAEMPRISVFNSKLEHTACVITNIYPAVTTGCWQPPRVA